MDRSTHPLLSPSSVTTHVSLIKAFRQEKQLSTLTSISLEAEELSLFATDDERTSSLASSSLASYFDVGSTGGTDQSVAEDSAFGPRGSEVSLARLRVILPSPPFHHPRRSVVWCQRRTPLDRLDLSSNNSSRRKTKEYPGRKSSLHDVVHPDPLAAPACLVGSMLEARCAVLTSILTACTGLALKAVEGLTQLLGKMDFFAEDTCGVGTCASSRRTLLD